MKSVLPWIISPIGAALGMFKKPAAPAAPMTPTRNLAAEAAMGADAMRRRRGAAATELVDRRAGEASSPGGKVLLGQ